MIYNNINNIIITVGGPRLDSIQNFYRKNNMEYILANSIVPAIKSKHYDCLVLKRGNAGLSIGHLRALEIASELDTPSNIFEDDEILYNNYIDKRNKLLSGLENWDYVNLNTHRPFGYNYNKFFKKMNKELLRYEPIRGWVNNIWLSNYCITPTFAKICLDMMVKNREQILWKRGKGDRVTIANICNCFSQDVYDQFFVLSISDIADKYNFYVTKNKNMISYHSEEDASIRQKYN